MAGAYRGQGTPAVFRLVEITTMEQAREWGVCTFNEFRESMGLKRLESFEEWNSDPAIAVSHRLCYISAILIFIYFVRTLLVSCTAILRISNYILAFRRKNV